MPAADVFRDGQRLLVKDYPANAAGEFTRVSIVQSSLKYPLIRLEERIVRAGHPNEERVLRREAAVADHLVVKLQPGADEGELAAVAAQYGGEIRRKLDAEGLYLVAIPATDAESLPNAVAAFSAEKAVSYAEPDYVVQHALMPNDTRFAQEWGLHNTGQTGGTADADIDAPEAWNIVTGSPSVVVAVIDTGVDYNHPDLTANMWTNPGETAGNGVDDDHNGYVDDVRGWDFYGEQNDPKDDHFHGTHVAGTIGAAGNNGRGVVGVNWQVKIMALKFLSAGGYGYTSDAVNAIHYATIKGARIMSCSWGGGGYSQSLKNMIDAAASAGVLMAAAAGNSSSDNDQYPMYPASYSCSNIIAVAATDSRDQLAWFSNYGATSVHLAAPGVGVLSTLPTVKTPAMTDYGLPTDYGSLSGTSMATPHVSGAAALALAQDPGLTLAQLRARIVQRTDHLSNLAGVVQSGGRLNAFNAVDPGGDEDPPPGPVKAAMLSPTNGTTFTSASVTFIWDAGVGVSKYALWVGSALRTYDIAGWVGTSLGRAVRVPTDGRTLYVTLWSWMDGSWQPNDYTYKAYTPPIAQMVNPTPGATLTGDRVNFEWAAAPGATYYALWVGSKANTYDVHASWGTGLSKVVKVPTDARRLYVTLWTWSYGQWRSNPYTYTAPAAAGPEKAVLNNPADGMTLTGDRVSIEWTSGRGVTSYYLWVGSNPNSYNLYGGWQSGLSRIVKVPTNGKPIYVTLWSLINGVWQSDTRSYTTYTAAVPEKAQMQTPTPGSTLTSGAVKFEWTSGVGATQWGLWVGSNPNSYDLYLRVETGLSRALTLPTDGRTLYVTLWSFINGAWHSNVYTYMAFTSP